MFGKISTSWELMKSSWQLLKKDKELMIFPILSSIAALIVIASFAIPVVMSLDTGGMEALDEEQLSPVYYLLLFLFYISLYFVIIFFNSAIVACASIRLNGGDPTVADGLRAAGSRLPQILGWSVVAASVGMLIRIVEEKMDWVGRIVAGFIGLAWTITSFMVIPLLVIEKMGPIEALKESAVLLKKTWGEQITTQFSFGLIFFLLALPAAGLVMLGLMIGSTVLTGILIGIAVLYILTLSVIQATLQGIFQATLYHYARIGHVAEEYSPALLAQAIQKK